MKIELHIIATVLSGVFIQSCGCDCTSKGCSEGVWVYVTLENTGTTDDAAGFPAGEYEIRWEINESSGKIGSENSISVAEGDEEIVFLIGRSSSNDSYRLSEEDQEIEIELFLNGVSISEYSTYPLEWQTTVCNVCSGGPWCDDNMVTSASINIDVESEMLPEVENGA
ncbi:MAG: hypothetical protein GY854_07340 [Deltaproteobacteria bacterium]|nr:hypothetical protein [Deltaproteobacteria bacterium]